MIGGNHRQFKQSVLSFDDSRFDRNDKIAFSEGSSTNQFNHSHRLLELYLALQ